MTSPGKRVVGIALLALWWGAAADENNTWPFNPPGSDPARSRSTEAPARSPSSCRKTRCICCYVDRRAARKCDSYLVMEFCSSVAFASDATPHSGQHPALPRMS
jgi:hypothetical protein